MKLSETFGKIDSMNYFVCLKQGHDCQPLNLVCADPSCKQRQLLCIYCEQSMHQTHSTLPLKEYLKKISISTYSQQDRDCFNEQSTNNPYNILNYSTKLDQHKHEYYSVLEGLRKLINQRIDELQSYGKLYTSELQKNMMGIASVRKQILEAVIAHADTCSPEDDMYMRNMKSGLKKMKSILRYGIMTGDVFNAEQSEFPIKEQLDALLKDCETRSAELQRKTKDIAKKFEKDFAEGLKALFSPHVAAYDSKMSFEWSNESKGASMQINKSVIEKIAQPQLANNQKFALFKNSLSPWTVKKRMISWTLKIVKLVGWIGLGICLKNRLVANKFQFKLPQLGHGSYMVSSNGYSWSSTEQTQNNANHKLSFGTADYVIIEYDPTTWKVNFQIHGKHYIHKKTAKNKLGKTAVKTVSLDIVAPINDEYYPCVCLCSVGDSVEIVNQTKY